MAGREERVWQDLRREVDERGVDRERIELRRQVRVEVVVADHVEQMAAVGQIGPPGQSLELLGDRVEQPKLIVEEIDEQLLVSSTDSPFTDRNQ